ADPPSDGRPPQQTDDIQRAIRAARSPDSSSAAFGKVNGKVVMVGGSSGACHAAWWALLGTNNDDRPEAVVCLSAFFDLDEAASLLVPKLKGVVQNYTNHLLTEGTPFHVAAQAASAYWQTPNGTPCPVLLINSTSETIPATNYNEGVTKFTDAGGTVESHLRTGTEHAWTYWDLGYGGSFDTVKDCAIDFLDRMILGGSPTPPPVAPAKIVLLRK
ncbi:MAG TPA: hypothetical protein VGM62_13890, partial [Chthoniobacterales bacterium]